MMKDVQIGTLTVSNDRPLLVIAGPCQLESLDHAQMIAGHMAEVCAAAGAQYVFKASFDKANRTSLNGKRGLGLEAGLQVLETTSPSLSPPPNWPPRPSRRLMSLTSSRSRRSSAARPIFC